MNSSNQEMIQIGNRLQMNNDITNSISTQYTTSEDSRVSQSMRYNIKIRDYTPSFIDSIDLTKFRYMANENLVPCSIYYRNCRLSFYVSGVKTTLPEKILKKIKNSNLNSFRIIFLNNRGDKKMGNIIIPIYDSFSTDNEKNTFFKCFDDKLITTFSHIHNKHEFKMKMQKNGAMLTSDNSSFYLIRKSNVFNFGIYECFSVNGTFFFKLFCFNSKNKYIKCGKAVICNKEILKHNKDVSSLQYYVQVRFTDYRKCKISSAKVLSTKIELISSRDIICQINDFFPEENVEKLEYLENV